MTKNKIIGLLLTSIIVLTGFLLSFAYAAGLLSPKLKYRFISIQ